MGKQHFWWPALAVSAALAACGGGSGDGNGNGSGDSGSSNPGGTGSITRIEPLDTAVAARSAEAGAGKAAAARADTASRLPAGVAVAQVTLPPLAAEKAAPARAAVAAKGAALQIGVGRDVAATAADADLTQRLSWQTVPGGAQVAAVRFTSPGARALRLAVRADALPAGAVLRFSGSDASAGDAQAVSAAEAAALRQANEAAGVQGDAARLVWGPDTAGETATLEIELPPGADRAALRLAVPVLSHLVQTVAEAANASFDKAMEIGNGGSCNLDVMCNASLQAESRAVAKMIFAKGADAYLCSGTLLNDRGASRTPYFLTAAHCIADQAPASSLITYWFFRAAACNATPRVDTAMTRVTGGAVLRATTAANDSTLLQLNGALPANVVYAGSYFGGPLANGTGVTGIHHPAGDLQKYSVGAVSGQANCSAGSDYCTLGTTDGSMYQVTWSQGTTEGGSSGSALFTQIGATRYVVGALHGGEASCAKPGQPDFYGRFDRAFAAGIGRYLAP